MSEEIKLPKRGTRAAFHDYEAFIKKFEAKKTTDDCYTPQPIYDVVLDYVFEKANLPEDTEIVRPFYPGGDYQAEEYPEGCVVVDNPPFSILAQIVAWYTAHGVKFFLFAPTLTLFSSTVSTLCTKIISGHNIVYVNGADIATSFLTNLWGDKAIICDGELSKNIEAANAELLASVRKKTKPVVFPDCVTSAAYLQKIPKRGVSLTIPAEEFRYVRKIGKQSIFGKGVILSTKATAAKLAAEEAAKLAAEEAAKTIPRVQLTDVELRILAELDGKVKTPPDPTLF